MIDENNVEIEAGVAELPSPPIVNLTLVVRFKCDPDEKVLEKGGMYCARGEVHPLDLKPGSYRAAASKVYLTTHRLVATQARAYHFFGPLIWLIWLFLPRKISFAIPLNSIAVIEAGTEKTGHFLVWMTDGQQCSFKPTNPPGTYLAWIQAITEQIAILRPDVEIITEGRSRFFQAKAAT